MLTLMVMLGKCKNHRHEFSSGRVGEPKLVEFCPSLGREKYAYVEINAKLNFYLAGCGARHF